MTEYMQVLTTVDSTEEAERLGRSITARASPRAFRLSGLSVLFTGGRTS